MSALRCRRLTRLCVLMLHLLVLGVAQASPWLRDDAAAWGPLCSGRPGAAAAAPDPASRALDCPLCLPLQAPPAAGLPMPADLRADAPPPRPHGTPSLPDRVAAPPARGPPH